MQPRTERGKAPALALLLAIFVSATGSLTPALAANYSAWDEPGPVDELNTKFSDGCPIQSPDGHSFYMAVNRPHPSDPDQTAPGDLDIWVAHRASGEDSWGPAEPLPTPINSEFDDFCPTPTQGKGLFFVSSRPTFEVGSTTSPSCGGGDIYFARQNPRHGWSQPVNLGCEVNSSGGEAGPSPFEVGGDSFLYFSSTRAGITHIYESLLRPDGSWGPARVVLDLSAGGQAFRPNVRKDGLEIFFDRPVAGRGFDIYSANRQSVLEPWSTPQPVDEVNSTANETRASLSWDGLTLFFGSNREGSLRSCSTEACPLSNDVYSTTRDKVSG